ncbi:XrtV sorting system accessory protein [Sphingomonas sp. RB1R13]|uniref:XrtV sorting system accessory protein n=1 Tax=Sphingomonas sp. RB1R13 TaxID=3096159 RepID=UPI002FC9401A
METAYDWVTVIIFAGLVTLFLSRSLDPQADDDGLWHYLFPAMMCGLANWLGNHGYAWTAVMLIAASLGYMLHFLRTPAPPRH